MIFDILLYAAATVTVLAFVGGRKHRAPATRPVVSTLDTLHAIGEALPSTEECFAIDIDVPDYQELFDKAEAIAPTPVQPQRFDCGDVATAEEAELVEVAEVAIALHWEAITTDNVVPFRRPSQHPALESLSIRALRQVVRDRKLKIAGYGSLPKAKLIAAIRAA